MTEHIVAIFERETAAAAAERTLLAARIPRPAIRRYNPQVSSVKTETAEQGGFWAWLGDDEPRSTYSQDHQAFERGVSNGNACISVTLENEAQGEQASKILADNRPLELDDDLHPGGVRTASRTSTTAAAMPRTGQGAQTEQVIPVREEQVDIGKHKMDTITRVRRYVVEKPVERDVTVRGEKVTVERRRPRSSADASGPFEERTVEMHETQEVPDVHKSARVVEVVEIKKEATERTEKISDTARREQVEVSEEGRDQMQRQANR
jgi:stress response protein YsnF